MIIEKTRSRNQIKRRKGTKLAEKNYMDRIAGLGCIICGGPACIHHLRHGRGMGQRSPHTRAIPLCFDHHQGRDGIHTLGTKKWQKIYGTELELLEKVKDLYYIKP